jgi:hypothetical protein
MFQILKKYFTKNEKISIIFECEEIERKCGFGQIMFLKFETYFFLMQLDELYPTIMKKKSLVKFSVMDT